MNTPMPFSQDVNQAVSMMTTENIDKELWFWTTGVWGGLQIGLVLLVTACLLRRYAAPEVDPASLVVTYLGWFSGLGGSLLLPFDLARSILRKQYDASKQAPPPVTSIPGQNTTTIHFADAVLPDDWELLVVTRFWMFKFWFTFVLAWAIIPSLQGFLSAEGFTWKRRLFSSIRKQLIGYAIMGVIAVAVLVWVVAVGWSLEKFLGMVMALANVYGLLFILVLLTHGLVTVPRHYFWERASFDKQLERCQCEAVSCESTAFEAEQDLQRCRRKVRKLDALITREGDEQPLREYMDVILARLETSETDHGDASPSAATHSDSDSSVASMANRDEDKPASWPSSTELKIRALEKIDAEMRTVIFRRDSTRALWRQLVARTTMLQHYVEGPDGGPPMQAVRDDDGEGSEDEHHAVTPQLTPAQWKSARLINTVMFKTLGAALYLLSWLVLWCEVTMALPWMLSPIGYLVLAAIPHGSYLAQLIMLVPLAYMSFCTYRSLVLFKLPCVRSHYMHAGRQTHAMALLFNAAYLCRLQFTLGFNFLGTLQIEEQWSATDFNLPECGFKTVVGSMDVFPLLGSSFSVFFPGVTLFVAVIMYFDLHRKLFRCFKIDEIASAVPREGTEEYEDRRREGKLLVLRAVSRRSRSTRKRPGAKRRKRRHRREHRRRWVSDSPRPERFAGRTDDAFAHTTAPHGRFTYQRV